MKAPPAEWPMMIGGASRASMAASNVAMISGTVALTMGVGSALRASTSTSKPG